MNTEDAFEYFCNYCCVDKENGIVDVELEALPNEAESLTAFLESAYCFNGICTNSSSKIWGGK